MEGAMWCKGLIYNDLCTFYGKEWRPEWRTCVLKCKSEYSRQFQSCECSLIPTGKLWHPNVLRIWAGNQSTGC